ncbi:hypothetical protein M6C35_001989 [Vibrio metschnikovii]|nr:hypothetical protein [Vibrio metschnikovii]
MTMSELQLKISHPELSHKGKITLIKKYLGNISGIKTTYGFSIADDACAISPAFKTHDAHDRVERGILDILNDMCEEMDNSGRGCSEFYNCCDCGGNQCGCAYCFSCRACDHCLADQ